MRMLIMIKNKLKAFLFHFILSVIVVSLVISTVIYFWYPVDYLSVTSFKEIALLIISIDLVIGPLLTFVVFNPKKKSLRFDLAVITLFQLSALTYGTYTLYETHPLYLTFNEGSFSLISAKDVQPENAKHSEYKISKLKSTKLAYVELPTDYENLMDVVIRNKTEGAQKLEQRTEFYKPYKRNIDNILTKSLDSGLILSDNILTQENPLLSGNSDTSKLAFFPLKGTKDAIIILDKETASPVGTINRSPWKYAKK